jgi:hypothetical protein
MYADIKLVIDKTREAQIKERNPDVSIVTLQDLRNEIHDPTMTDGVRSDIILGYLNMSLFAAPRTAASASAADAAANGCASVSNAAPRRADRRVRVSDMPTWERNPWLPVRPLSCSCCVLVANIALQGLMIAYGDARNTSTDSIRVVEGLLTHFVTVVLQHCFCVAQCSYPTPAAPPFVLPACRACPSPIFAARGWRRPRIRRGPVGSEQA